MSLYMFRIKLNDTRFYTQKHILKKIYKTIEKPYNEHGIWPRGGQESRRYIWWCLRRSCHGFDISLNLFIENILL